MFIVADVYEDIINMKVLRGVYTLSHIHSKSLFLFQVIESLQCLGSILRHLRSLVWKCLHKCYFN